MGVVHVRDLLKAMAEDKMDLKVSALSKEASFVPESNRGNDLLHHFKQSKQHLVIVMNAFGTVLGVLSLEDVLEELVGDIVDETDVEQEEIHILSETELLVSPEADTLEIADILQVELPEMRLGEYVLQEFGRIPKVGESLNRNNINMIVEAGTPRAITQVRIKKIAVESAS